VLVDDFVMRGLACRPAWHVIHGDGLRHGDVVFVEPGLGPKGKNTPDTRPIELEFVSGGQCSGCLLRQLGECSRAMAGCGPALTAGHFLLRPLNRGRVAFLPNAIGSKALNNMFRMHLTEMSL
jgi:hypothetical protein